MVSTVCPAMLLGSSGEFRNGGAPFSMYSLNMFLDSVLRTERRKTKTGIAEYAIVNDVPVCTS